MDEKTRRSIVFQVRWILDEVAPRDYEQASAAFHDLFATYGRDMVIAALHGDPQPIE